jgi:hypothetical protein
MSWWESDPRYGQQGWTLIHPIAGAPYFVRAQPKKRRKPARALRFGDLQPGAVLIHRGKITSTRFEHHDRIQAKGRDLPFANDDGLEVTTVTPYAGLAICTDRWFDPVLGEDDPLKGELAAVVPITGNGRATGKRSHTLRGLAMQGYSYATPEQAERVLAFTVERAQLTAAWKAGTMTQDEVRAAATPWRTLLREIGVET